MQANSDTLIWFHGTKNEVANSKRHISSLWLVRLRAPSRPDGWGGGDEGRLIDSFHAALIGIMLKIYNIGGGTRPPVPPGSIFIS